MEYVNVVQGTLASCCERLSQEALKLFCNLKKEISLRNY